MIVNWPGENITQSLQSSKLTDVLVSVPTGTKIPCTVQNTNRLKLAFLIQDTGTVLDTRC